MLQMLRNADRPALLTFIGTALIKFATGVIGIWGTINIYFLSYLRNHGTIITSLTNSLIMLCAIIPSAVLVLLATRFSKLFGYKRVIRVSALIFCLTPFLINVWMNLFTLGLFYLFIPVTCFAFSSIPILNCLWSQFPKDLNKVSGSAVLFFALGMIVWNVIFMKVTNPQNQPALIDQNNQAYFNNVISDNIFKASNIMFACSGFCFVLGSLLVSKRSDTQVKVQNKLEEQSPPENDVRQSQIIIMQTPAELKIKPNPLKLKQALKDIKFKLLFAISFLVPLYLIYMVLYMKLIFMPIINDDHYLAYCSVVLTSSAIIGAPFWGYIGDKKGFKKTLLIVIAVDLVCKIFGLFCNEKWNLIILYFMLGFNDKGILTIVGPGLIQIFGLQMATQLIPYKGISIFLAYVAVPLIQILVSNNYSYQIILTLFIGCSFGAMTLSYHFYSKVDYQPFSDKEVGETKAIQQKTKQSSIQTKKTGISDQVECQ